VVGREECGFCKQGKKIDPDLSSFSQPAGLRVRSISPVLFQVFGPVGHVRRTSGGLDHRISVVVVVVIGGRGIVTSGGGGSRYSGITAGGAAISAGATAAVGAGGDGGGSGYVVVGGGGTSGDGGNCAFGVEGKSGFGVGNSGGFGFGVTTTVVVVNVGYDYSVGGAIGSVAVGPPKHSQHNIRAKGCRYFSETAATRKWSVVVYEHPPGVNETSTKPSNGLT